MKRFRSYLVFGDAGSHQFSNFNKLNGFCESIASLEGMKHNIIKILIQMLCYLLF